MIIGVDTKAACKYEGLILDHVPKDIPVRMLGTTFGNARPTFKDFVSRGYLDLVYDSVWDNNHNHGAAAFTQAVADAKWIRKISDDYNINNQQLYFCPFLEHRLKGAALRARMNTILELVGSKVWVVNNPIRGGNLLNMRGVINCVHHEDRPTGNPKGYHGWYIYSEDGRDSKNRNVQAKLNKEKRNGCALAFTWVPQNNLKTDKQNSGHAPTPAPKNRRSAVMSADMLKAQVYWEKPRGRASLNKKHVWKAFAEHKNIPPSSRELKPVFITPDSFREVIIQNVKGRAREKLNYTGREHGVGRHIWRYSKFGYEKATKCERQTGKPQIDIIGVKANGRKEVLGRINPAYRVNDYK